MRKSVTVWALIHMAWAECSGQVPQNRLPGPAPAITIGRGKSQMDGSHWTILSLPAKTAYRNTIGISVRPVLRLECLQSLEERSFHIVLESGPLEYIHDGYVVLV